MNITKGITKEMLRTIMCAASLFLLLGCFKKNTFVFDASTKALYIDMPQTVNIFENVAPVVYNSLYNHFDRVGYKLTSKQNASMHLKSVITRYDTEEKLVSPDVLPYVFRMWIDIDCSLFDEKGTLIAHKKFTFSSFASRPRDVHFTAHYATFELERMLNRYVPRIDYYFRKYFLPSR